MEPFRNFEDLFDESKGRDEETTLLDATPPCAERLFKLMPLLRADLLLVCSNLLPYDPISTPLVDASNRLRRRTLGHSPGRIHIGMGENPIDAIWRGPSGPLDLWRNSTAFG